MGTTSKPFYAATCDYPGCGAVDDGGEYAYWSEPEYAISTALEADWSEEDLDSSKVKGEPRLFCDGHATHIQWRSDEVPEPDGEDARILTLPDGERVVLA